MGLGIWVVESAKLHHSEIKGTAINAGGLGGWSRPVVQSSRQNMPKQAVLGHGTNFVFIRNAIELAQISNISYTRYKYMFENR